MKIRSWNVNGLRACAGKGFLDWLEASKADVLLLQETKARRDQLDPAVREPKGWTTAFAAGERPGYSGVAVYSRREPNEIVEGIGIPRFDREGRVLMARYGRLCVLSVYFPNGGNDCARVPYKLEFYEALRAHCDELRRRGRQVVIGGDWNTAHREIDLARPKENAKTSGFLPEEREALDVWARAGWVDTFRHVHPGRAGAYSWWTYRAGARERNVGWRLDYHFVSPSLRARVKGATIHPEVAGSDHCPVGLDLAD